MQHFWLYPGIGGGVQENTSRVEHDVSIIPAGTRSVQRMRVPGKHGKNTVEKENTRHNYMI